MTDTTEIKTSIEASIKFQELMQGVLPSLIFGVESFIENSENPNVQQSSSESKHILNGIIIVYLFSLWDSYFSSDTIDRYLKDDEKELLYAFKHIRIVAAHNTDGNRKSNRPNKDRMDHAEKLDSVMSSNRKIEGLRIEHYNFDLSQSNVVLDCRQFMQNISIELPIRISTGINP